MTKFSLEKKQEAVQRVKEGYSIAQVARETGISEEVIRNVWWLQFSGHEPPLFHTP
jgi:transposase-like protein